MTTISELQSQMCKVQAEIAKMQTLLQTVAVAADSKTCINCAAMAVEPIAPKPTSALSFQELVDSISISKPSVVDKKKFAALGFSNVHVVTAVQYYHGNAPKKPKHADAIEVLAFIKRNGPSRSTESKPPSPSKQRAKQPPQPLSYFIDTESVATGRGHSDRAVAQCTVIDANGGIVMDTPIKVVGQIFSYMTPLTGVTAKMYEKQPPVPVEQVRGQLVKLLQPGDVLVAASLASDCSVLGLEFKADAKKEHEGIVYLGDKLICKGVDVTKCFPYKHKPHWSAYHPLARLAQCFLGKIQTAQHSPQQDANLHRLLYAKFKAGGVNNTSLARLSKFMKVKSTASGLGFTIEGVCIAGFSPDKCTCGQPALN